MRCRYDAITTELRADRSRVFLTGLSMGGFGTWAWAAHSPTRFGRTDWLLPTDCPMLQTNEGSGLALPLAY
jgi:dienelactone hydrolase